MYAVLLAMGILLVAAGPVPAAKPCRSACKATHKTCVAAANADFTVARTACRALDPGPARAACMKVARDTRASVKQPCRVAKAACIDECGDGGGDACRGSNATDWLATVNLYRDLAGLPAVTERADWTAGAQAHAEYTAREDVVGHTENPSSPAYSAAGAEAAANGNVAGHSSPDRGFGWAIDAWMTGPFHAVGIVDPLLAESGFGLAHDGGGSLRTGAVLDVIRGRTGELDAVTFPIVYPRAGGVLPLARYDGNEYPDPLSACPGYEAPTGPPLVLQFGSFVDTPAIGATSLTRDGMPVDHCVFDGTTYVNGDAAAQATARNGLAARAAVVVMPRDPLKRGSTYAVSVEADGQTIAWSFVHDCP